MSFLDRLLRGTRERLDLPTLPVPPTLPVLYVFHLTCSVWLLSFQTFSFVGFTESAGPWPFSFAF